MRPRKKRAMDTTDKMETSASANQMTIATAIIIAFGLLSGVALIVIVILLLVKFRAILCRRCCPSSYGLNKRQAVDLPTDESGNNCHTVEAKGTEARTSEVNLAEVSTINELKGSCREDNNNQYENGIGALNQADNLRLLTKDVIQEQPAADIERCRDNEHADIEEPQFSSLSDLTEMIQDIISSHMRQTNDGISNSSDGSLLPMTPESNNALAVIEIHQTDAQSQHDDHDLDSNAHSNADRCQALEADTPCRLPSLIPMDAEDVANNSADSKDAGSKIVMETVMASGNSTPPLVAQETDPKSQSGNSFSEMTTVYDEALDYDSFVSSLQLGERHSMLITENQSFNNSDTDGEDITPPIQPSSDVDIFSTVISTPCKIKADEMNVDREKDDSAHESAPKKKPPNSERLEDQNSVLLLTAQEVRKIGGSESSSSTCNQKTDAAVDDDNRNDICPNPEQRHLKTSIGEINQWRGNSTCEMLQSYINISITADGPKEKATFQKPTDSFRHTVEVHRKEDSSPVKSEANNTGLCPSDSIGLEVVIPKSEQCSIKGNKVDTKLQIDDPDDIEKSLTISNCTGNRDETPKVSTTKDDQILVAPSAECEMNRQSDNNCDDFSNNNSCLKSDSYSTLINSISSNSSIC